MNAGFEWRRYDAPELVPSSRSNCPIVDGVMMGCLRNLSANTYYKFRPFYISAEGKEYYGDWSAFGTSDAYVYFEPTVRTFEVSNIKEDKATIRGIAIMGSDAIVEQGFEYWETGKNKISNLSHTLNENRMQIVISDGQWMTSTLENLNSGTTYEVRAFVKTCNGITYGNTETFTTANLTGINNITKSKDKLSVKITNISPSNFIINVEGIQGKGFYQLYKINGIMIDSGILENNNEQQTIRAPFLERGIYLLKVNDNEQVKTIRFLIN